MRDPAERLESIVKQVVRGVLYSGAHRNGFEKKKKKFESAVKHVMDEKAVPLISLSNPIASGQNFVFVDR